MIVHPPLREDDVKRAINLIEMAAIYLKDGAPNTALDRLNDAMPVIVTWAAQRESLFDLLDREGAPS